jgi:hypothetical protein
MDSEDPCFTCVLRTAAALGWTLELPDRPCPLTAEQDDHDQRGLVDSDS